MEIIYCLKMLRNQQSLCYNVMHQPRRLILVECRAAVQKEQRHSLASMTNQCTKFECLVAFKLIQIELRSRKKAICIAMFDMLIDKPKDLT